MIPIEKEGNDGLLPKGVKEKQGLHHLPNFVSSVIAKKTLDDLPYGSTTIENSILQQRKKDRLEYTKFED